ncbi:ATP-binding protein [Streptomyces genisteinicus]|uniref:ATP-binding protein n=1 Tax=Streptomyces genisteinicus TaxID=2768068 RepID=UPI003CCE2536
MPSAALAAAAVAGAAVTLAAPDAAGPWVAATACAAWLCLAAAAVTATLALRRERAAADAAGGELRTVRSRSDGLTAEASHLVNVTLPSLVKQLRDGEAPEEALASATPPKDPQLRRVLHAFGMETGASEQRARGSAANAARAVRQLALAADGVDRLTSVTLPTAVAHLRRGASAETVLGELELPADPRLRVLADSAVRELALGERRAAAAQEASAKALSRVQAKAVSMLADLREMQDRYGEEVFGDLLRLDHNTAQLGLLTDRLALLMGGRASRAWNRPIPMESILRGAVGRIAAYRRVRLHSSSTAAVVGFAAEGVMHLLAELMDNAATFSPPVDEVHVYVEERTAGIVVTIEDSGLKMAGAALRRAEEAVSGRVTDLAHLQGTRLGLTVVGRLAAKYGMSVSFRPSSRGGTGVVVLFPSQLLAKPRDEEDEDLARPLPASSAPAAPTATGSGTSPSGGPVPGAREPGGYPAPADAASWAAGDGTQGGQGGFAAAHPVDLGDPTAAGAAAWAGPLVEPAHPPLVEPAHPGTDAWGASAVGDTLLGQGSWADAPGAHAGSGAPGAESFRRAPHDAHPAAAGGAFTTPPAAAHGTDGYALTPAAAHGTDGRTAAYARPDHTAPFTVTPAPDATGYTVTPAEADGTGGYTVTPTDPNGTGGFTVTPADAHGTEGYTVTPAHPNGTEGFTVTAAGPAVSGAAAGSAAPAGAPAAPLVPEPYSPAPFPAQAPVRGVATAGGLPVRPPGRTMAAADRGRGDASPPARTAPVRDAGSGFEAFARSVGGRRRSLGAGGTAGAYDATPAAGTYLPDGSAGQPPPESAAPSGPYAGPAASAPDAPRPLPEPRTPHDPQGGP